MKPVGARFLTHQRRIINKAYREAQHLKRSSSVRVFDYTEEAELKINRMKRDTHECGMIMMKTDYAKKERHIHAH